MIDKVRARSELRVERPNVMRAEVVDKYIKSIIDLGAQMAI